MANTEMPLTLAAHRVGLTWAQMWTRVLSGEVTGTKRGARWYVSTVDVEKLARKTSALAAHA